MPTESNRAKGLTFLVRQAWLSMRSVVAAALADFDLSVAQYASLHIIELHPGSSVADVGREVASTRQSANEMLAGLERAGLLERRPHPTDRRSQQFYLTAAGTDRLNAARPAVERVEAELEAGFTARDRTAARAWLTRMAKATPDDVDG